MKTFFVIAVAMAITVAIVGSASISAPSSDSQQAVIDALRNLSGAVNQTAALIVQLAEGQDLLTQAILRALAANLQSGANQVINQLISLAEQNQLEQLQQRLAAAEAQLQALVDAANASIANLPEPIKGSATQVLNQLNQAIADAISRINETINNSSSSASSSSILRQVVPLRLPIRRQ